MRAWALLLVVLAGATLVAAMFALPPVGAPDAPIHEHVGRAYLERGPDATGLENVVTSVLLHFRGFDTFGEVVVIFTALLALLGLPHTGLAPSSSEGRTGDAASQAGPVVAEGPGEGPRGARDVPISPVALYVVRTLTPFIALFALATLAKGHAAPGGGFQAASLLAALFVALALVVGRRRVERRLPTTAAAWLQAAAPLAFVLVAAIGAATTGAFLGYPAALPLLRSMMSTFLEVAIAVGGATILARLFLALEG